MIYDRPYYNGFRDGSLRSARVIVPLIMDWIAPASVIDLGCGLGDWLSVFKDSGVKEILGVDGSHVRQDQLAISETEFTPYDLSAAYHAARRYDLAVSVEVAEHLPPQAARPLIESLTELAPAVLFSAAIPKQPGKCHINCQWPAYWAELFAGRGYVPIDGIRPRLWNDSRVDWWYRQNIILYASEKHLDRWPNLKRLRAAGQGAPLPLVHPEMLLQIHEDLVNWGADWESKYWELWAQEPDRRVEV